ncbi:23S rRNA (guanosine(2251)-2'-O)-methyltransferase RlmB [Cellulosilyticum sp. WCF-2]|uniref:23S rRNA (guanosine(2251)-2'-O)-methyltransferase RlmB n=1 Tax=Cellulosilyticum sp. WCF-2 TaxID=2497860 RepID=UPI001FAA8E2B|nr:23S rRNA (guanosine(2251)-2'-O)-methyltransferase RlmB [Cellulosilyticum sp. WCF-2]
MRNEMRNGKAKGKKQERTDKQPNQENKLNKRESFKKEKPEFTRGYNRRSAVPEDFEIDENILFGRNAVIEALKSEREIDKILIQKGEKEGSVIKIISAAKAKSIVTLEVEKSKLDELTGREKHQGVVAYVAAHEYVSVEEILEDAAAKGEPAFVLILENIQDPHNLGAIIRTAHTAGVHGIIIPKRRAVGLTGTVAKASAGALEHTKVAKVSNIAQTIKDLQQKGLWIACADMDGKVLFEENLTGPIGIVVGSEGEGVSKLTKQTCDYVVSVPMYGKVTSLNASVAASLMVYEVVRQRHFK